MFQSIRWRLPLSYAALVLLAALVLGAVLLAVLRAVYLRQEREHLTTNAAAIAEQVGLLLSAAPETTAIEAQLQGFAFLSQTRVRLLGAGGEVVADSGRAGAAPVTVSLNIESPGTSQSLTTAAGEADEAVVGTTVRVETSANGGGQTVDIASVISGSAALGRLPIVGTLFGFGLGGEAASGPRSQLAVRYPVSRPLGQPAAYVELSQGPAFGQDIVRSVAWGWAAASVVAVLLATAVGWGMSQRLSQPLLALTRATARVAGGEWSARAEVGRDDELGALARRFNAMAQQVEQTITTLRRFVADASHELRTPTTALRTFNDLLQSEAVRDEAVRAEFLAESARQISRLEWITANLLDLSRLDAGLIQLQRAPVDARQMVEAVVASIRPQAEARRLTWRLQVPAEPPRLLADRAWLDVALANLVDNAVKFSPEGGVVSVGVDEAVDGVRLWVCDGGPGIEPEDQPHIFERFYRGQGARTAGSGLGLAIAQSVVQAHGGRLSVNSAPDQGSRFEIWLPARAGSQGG